MLVTIGIGASGGAAPFAGAQDGPPEATPSDCPATTPEETTELVRRFIDEVYVGRDASRVDAFLSGDFNRANPARPHSNEPGNADDAARVERSLAEFPDHQSTIEALIGEDDIVVVMMRISGTHQGDFADLGVPATVRPAAWRWVIVWRVACGQLVENRVVTDRLTQYRQLGSVTDDELAAIDTPTAATPTP